MLFTINLVDINLELLYLPGEMTFCYHYEEFLTVSSNASYLFMTLL